MNDADLIDRLTEIPQIDRQKAEELVALIHEHAPTVEPQHVGGETGAGDSIEPPPVFRRLSDVVRT